MKILKSDENGDLANIKCFKLLNLILLGAKTYSLIGILLSLNVEILPEFIFIGAFINYIFIIPILFIIQIITLIMKIIAKDKHQKDWLMILLNSISILFFGGIIICAYGVALAL